MGWFRSFVIIALPLFFISHSRANYTVNARSSVALYWGQGPGQQRLLHFCQQASVDIIPLAFVDIFPEQGNGFPGTNFGNQCWGGSYVYKGPGNDSALNQLQSECPQLIADIPVCQTVYGKKILLSLGGGTTGYQLTGTENGEAFADFLWGAFGPRTQEWLDSGLPRPFDGPNNQSVEVDGFDFDIQVPSTDNEAGYIAMVQRLRSNFVGANKPKIITGAPQCIVPDANMGSMITSTQFDIIWIQYYNTPQCSARNWANANQNYLLTGIEAASGFSYDTWADFLSGTASANAKLYIGLPGAPATADPSSDFYLNTTEMSSLVKAYYCKANFGGIMIWEATAAENNVGPNGTFYQDVKDVLLGYDGNSLLCSISPGNNTSRRRIPATRMATAPLTPTQITRRNPN